MSTKYNVELNEREIDLIRQVAIIALNKMGDFSIQSEKARNEIADIYQKFFNISHVIGLGPPLGYSADDFICNRMDHKED